MPYVQSFLSTFEVQTASNNEINTILENVQRLTQKSAQNDEYSSSDYNLNVIINRLNNRITELEEKDSYQTVNIFFLFSLIRINVKLFQLVYIYFICIFLGVPNKH